MKATLVYNLDDPEDVRAHLRAIKSLDMVICLNQLANRIRETFKYDKEPINHEEFWEIVSSYVNLDELVN